MDRLGRLVHHPIHIDPGQQRRQARLHVRRAVRQVEGRLQHRLRQALLPRQFRLAVSTVRQMLRHAVVLFGTGAAVDDPGDRRPGPQMGLIIRPFDCHDAPLVLTSWPTARAGSKLRSLTRAWNILAFTVLTGHCMIAEISSSEWPPP